MATEQQSESPARDRFRSTRQSPSELGLIPYAQVNGSWTISDALVLQIAQKFQDEGTFHRVFYEGFIRTPTDFLEMIKKPANLPVFVFRGYVPVGVAWLNGLCGNHAFAHFCFARASWGVDSERVGELILQYWMNLSRADARPIFDVIIGVIPATNPKAARFVERIGFVRLGEIPMMLKDAYSGDRAAAVILYYSRFTDGRIVR